MFFMHCRETLMFQEESEQIDGDALERYVGLDPITPAAAIEAALRYLPPPTGATSAFRSPGFSLDPLGLRRRDPVGDGSG
jgi:hypothetical protein